ncbi:ATP-dependent zinc protease [candidate division KSB1 bacterium]|nr:ATP-dependent zinc protease [candidate division KSB1 bacterium]
MPSTFKNLVLPALLAGVTALSHLAHAESPRNLGWIEHGVIEPADMTVKFKLDTGALTSSMHAEDIERFERDGQQWVRFKVTLEDLKSDRLISETFERPLERDLRVRGAGGSTASNSVTASTASGAPEGPVRVPRSRITRASMRPMNPVPPVITTFIAFPCLVSGRTS